jgi:hypothetical protein
MLVNPIRKDHFQLVEDWCLEFALCCIASSLVAIKPEKSWPAQFIHHSSQNLTTIAL